MTLFKDTDNYYKYPILGWPEKTRKNIFYFHLPYRILNLLWKEWYIEWVASVHRIMNLSQNWQRMSHRMLLLCNFFFENIRINRSQHLSHFVYILYEWFRNQAPWLKIERNIIISLPVPNWRKEKKNKKNELKLFAQHRVSSYFQPQQFHAFYRESIEFGIVSMPK